MVSYNKHDENLVSIKCPELNIEAKDWDLLFDAYSDKAHFMFFKGYKYQGLGTSSESALISISRGSLTISRNNFSKLWNDYEFPAVFFICFPYSKEQVTGILSSTFYIKETLMLLKSTYVMFKSFEEDVLWIGKSNDTEFDLQFP